jgi:hypothetical protein
MVSVVTLTIMGFLLLSELYHFRSLKYSYEFLIDTEVKTQMDVNLDVTVAMNCEYLRLDILDVAGTSLPIRVENSPTVYTTEGAVDLAAYSFANISHLNETELQQNQHLPIKDNSWHLNLFHSNKG